MLRFCFAGALCALVYASVANGFEVEMEYSVDANGKPHTKILHSGGNDFAEHDRTFLTQMRNHMRAAAEASHHAHRSPLQGLFDSIDHIFNDRNEDQDPFSALHELTHRSHDAEGHMHQDFVRPHRPRGHGPILDIQRMIQTMVRPLFEPRELRHAEEGPPRPLVAMACHQDAVQYCRKYCSCWKGMTTCLERNQERLRPRCRHLLVAKGLIEEVAPEEKAMQEAKQVMPPSHLQEKLRKIHDKVTSEISATEAEENAKHAVEEGKALLHREHHEERELEKEAELTKGEETPGYLLGDVEKPLGEKDMGGWTMRVYTPEQQARLHVDEEGNKVEPATKDAATQTPEPQIKDAVPPHHHKSHHKFHHKFHHFLRAMKARVRELHPKVLMASALALFVLAFFVGYCRCCKKRSDALSGQYASITQELQPAGSHEQL